MSKVAKLVSVSLMVRVIADEVETDVEIWRKAKPKLKAVIDESGMDNLEFIEDDIECPYEEGEESARINFDNRNRRAIGYQITSNDNRHEIPPGLYSFIILSESAADLWLKRNSTTEPTRWKKIPVYDGDIEDPVFQKYL